MKAPVVYSLAAAAFFAAHAGAIEKYAGTVTGKCVKHGNATYNVVATVTGNWRVEGLSYSFSNPPVHATATPNPMTRYFLVKPGHQTVTVGNPAHQGTHTIEVPKCDLVIGDVTTVTDRWEKRHDVPFTDGSVPAAKGMTWSVLQTNPVNGTSRVGCKTGCDPRAGDTPCSTPLPLLCVKKSGPGFPLPPPAGFNNNDQYNKWAGGIIATTAPVAAPATLGDANKACATAFGADWRVAEFHDGWGWAFWAYGASGDPSKRFRVHVNDQPANCWK